MPKFKAMGYSISTAITIAILMFTSNLAPSCWTNAEHIVFLLTAASYSHRAPHWPLVEDLVAKGHKVTYISPYEGSKALSNPKVEEVKPSNARAVMQFTLDRFDINHRIYGLIPPGVLIVEPLMYATCLGTLNSPEFTDWLSRTEKVDLIMVDLGIECAYGVAKKFNAKYASFYTLPLITSYYESFGIPPETGSVPDLDTVIKPPLSFFGRAINAVLPLIFRVNKVIAYNFYPSLFREYLGLKDEEIPTLYEGEKNLALLMMNGGYLEDFPRPLPPLVINLPGMHINDKDKQLEPSLEKFLRGDNYTGFIYISFGTVAKAPSLPEYFRKVFFEAISMYPDVKFVWRWEGTKPESYPDNLYLIPWLNQQGLLQHKNIRGFVTQGGRPSLQEAFYHGVPTVSIPILADQDFNSVQYEYLGVSTVHNIRWITVAKLKTSFDNFVRDDKLKKRAERMAKLARDVPISSRKKALWWTEFILRHSNEELNLMKPLAQDLWWFQRREFDVWLFNVLVLFLLSILTKKLGIKTYSWVRGKRMRNDGNSTKRVKKE